MAIAPLLVLFIRFNRNDLLRIQQALSERRKIQGAAPVLSEMAIAETAASPVPVA